MDMDFLTKLYSWICYANQTPDCMFDHCSGRDDNLTWSQLSLTTHKKKTFHFEQVWSQITSSCEVLQTLELIRNFFEVPEQFQREKCDLRHQYDQRVLLMVHNTSGSSSQLR